MLNLTIRQATATDASTIGMLHAASWKIAYRNILSDSFLDNDLESERKKFWEARMQGLKPNEFVFIAESGNRAVGFIAVLDKPEKGYKAFIDNLHAHPDFKGKGIGSMLMKAAAEKLSRNGIDNVYLWVLIGNDKAEGFYKAIGGRPSDTSTVNFGGRNVGQTRFVWDTLRDLLKIK